MAVAALVVTLVASGCGGGSGNDGGDGRRAAPTTRPSAPPSPVVTAAPVDPPSAGAVRLLAAGDVASCEHAEDEATAALVAAEREATFLLLGDVVYDEADDTTLDRCFLPAWRSVLSRTYAVAGNHDVVDGGLRAFFSVFGDRAGRSTGGWFRAELGDWTLLGLNSNCGQAGGCERGSPQHDWFVAELAAVPPGRCVVAAWHHTPLSSGAEHNGTDDRVLDLWHAAFDAGVDLVLTAHEHNYERFEPLGRDLRPAAGGLPLFVVGTGGFDLYDLGERQPGSAVLHNRTHGLLQVDLSSGSFTWRFRAVGRGSLTDAGAASCR